MPTAGRDYTSSTDTGTSIDSSLRFSQAPAILGLGIREHLDSDYGIDDRVGIAGHILKAIADNGHVGIHRPIARLDAHPGIRREHGGRECSGLPLARANTPLNAGRRPPAPR
jgi:hypothetical protein